MDTPAARAAQEDIETAERWLTAHPAPAPDGRVVAAIKGRMAASLRRRYRIVRLAHAGLAAAAAVIVLALIGTFGPRPTSRPRLSYAAAILPAAIWESDDLTTDDLDLAYFSAEIRHVEAQMHALEAGDSEVSGTDASDEIEMELLALQADFWKG